MACIATQPYLPNNLYLPVDCVIISSSWDQPRSVGLVTRHTSVALGMPWNVKPVPSDNDCHSSAPRFPIVALRVATVLGRKIKGVNRLAESSSSHINTGVLIKPLKPPSQSHQLNRNLLTMLLSTIVPYLVLAATGLAAVIPETNGDRLRRGLTPKQPARRWDASRTHCRL